MDVVLSAGFLQRRQDKLNELKDKIASLENQVTKGFPGLAQLLRSYSLILSEVKVVKAISDKASELITTVPDKAPLYTGIFINQIEATHGQIGFGIGQLPDVDNREAGELKGKLDSIRDLIRDIKKENDIQDIKRIFDNISTQYTDVQAILSRLVERILSSFELKS
ncbi:hypothetical protein A6S26_35030 [Nostoc sp. ATCC 43529]|nr:hypothetical protein A6S26_35030 [Nostoc sp. ATCC 43529]